jgi:hypothetical protein
MGSEVEAKAFIVSECAGEAADHGTRFVHLDRYPPFREFVGRDQSGKSCPKDRNG